MKKLILLAFIGYSVTALAQNIAKNGTIYKEHPYITAIKQLNDFFVKGDTTNIAKFYADSAKFYDAPAYVSSTSKGMTLSQAKANWKDIFANWDIKSIKVMGYPDALAYDKDPFTVQSWWIIDVTNKKTQKNATFLEVIFDNFNKDGKITSELSYYDTAQIMAAMK